MSRYYLGVDGGQSSTLALIADETGTVVGSGRGGPCNHVAASEGRDKFTRAINGSLSQACLQAHLDPVTITFAAACLGLSGGSADKEPYARDLIRSAAYKITHDAEIALTGATAGDPGIIVIAGTGSIAFGRNAHNKNARAGGWGYVFGDEGGGFDLSRKALRAALRAEEGWGPATLLRDLLLEKTGAPSANHLMHNFYTPQFPRDHVASLAVLVTQAASEGDTVALKILQDAAADLASLVEGVHQQLFPRRLAVPVAHIGNVFRSAPLRTAFLHQVQDRTGCQAGPARFSPAAGALMEAMRLDGIQVLPRGVPESGK